MVVTGTERCERLTNVGRRPAHQKSGPCTAPMSPPIPGPELPRVRLACRRNFKELPLPAYLT